MARLGLGLIKFRFWVAHYAWLKAVTSKCMLVETWSVWAIPYTNAPTVDEDTVWLGFTFGVSLDGFMPLDSLHNR